MVAKIPARPVKFAEFRSIFLIPEDAVNRGARYLFKAECEDGSAPYEWQIAMEDSLVLPVFEGRIIAETRTASK